MTALPYAGLKVVDLTRVLAGPYCTMVLGDLGADVIKVERLPGGDDSRRMGPFAGGESYCFAQVNRNKRRVALDLKKPDGRGVLALSTVEEAAERIEAVNADYEMHRKAAREAAEEVFSYRVVLPRLLEAALSSRASSSHDRAKATE